MAKSLLFLPDISGYTKFIQTTEVEHSQHIISELLEVLIAANTENMELAEIEGDALFFYKEGEVPSQERLLAQIETMFTAFYNHLEFLKKNRICPCNACATAPDLELKIIAHAGQLQHIEVQGTRKPFGQQVIEAHRLMKNSVNSDNYVLISRSLAFEIQLSAYYSSKLFRFRQGSDHYDDTTIDYLYSLIDTQQLPLKEPETVAEIEIERPADLIFEREYPVGAEKLYEYISNLIYRAEWVKGVDRFDFKVNEVTRCGTEHVCVVNGKDLNFVSVTKAGEPGQLVYGEMTRDLLPVDAIYQFYTITPLSENTCHLKVELFWEAKSPLKRIMIALFAKKAFEKNTRTALEGLFDFAQHKRSDV
ncbi:DUF2652 domain-containing protein [Flagellimonas sp. DF-77]|uniref:DUF2652 domain-containing protein n=1 Tax=Flagellimonas algarum TaxID=3230298 RepID=UPI0033921DB0